MSTDTVQQHLHDILSSLTPASVISKGYEGIFHKFFSKGTTEEIRKLLCPITQTEHSVNDLFSGSDQCRSLVQQKLRSPPSLQAPLHVRGTFRPRNVNLDTIPQNHGETSNIFHNVTSSEYAQKNPGQALSSNAREAIKLLKSARVFRKEDIETFLGPRKEVVHTKVRDLMARYAKLQKIFDESENNESLERYVQRITLLLMNYVLESIAETKGSGKRGVRPISLAIKEVAEYLGKSTKDINNYRTRSRHYLTIFKNRGLGALALLGDNNRLWEQTLKDNDVTLIEKYVDEPTNLQEWKRHCEVLNLPMASVAMEVLRRCGWDSKSIPPRLKEHIESITTEMNINHVESSKRMMDDIESDDFLPATKRRELETQDNSATTDDTADPNVLQLPLENTSNCVCGGERWDCVCYIIPSFNIWDPDWDQYAFTMENRTNS